MKKNHMKILTVEDYKPIDKNKLSEAYYNDGPLSWDWVGLEPDDGGSPMCWLCSNYDDYMVRFKEIGDWYNEMICAGCIDKLKVILDELRGLATTANEVK